MKKHYTSLIVAATLLSVAKFASAAELTDNAGHHYTGNIISENAGQISIAPKGDAEVSLQISDLTADSQSAVKSWEQAHPDCVNVYRRVDQNPVPTRTVMPHLPAEVRAEGITGMVSVSAIIDEHGNVVSPQILKASHEELAEPALHAIASWKFRPGKKDGKAVKTRIVIPFRFS